MNFPLLTYHFIEWLEEQDVKEKNNMQLATKFMCKKVESV